MTSASLLVQSQEYVQQFSDVAQKPGSHHVSLILATDLADRLKPHFGQNNVITHDDMKAMLKGIDKHASLTRAEKTAESLGNCNIDENKAELKDLIRSCAFGKD